MALSVAESFKGGALFTLLIFVIEYSTGHMSSFIIRI